MSKLIRIFFLILLLQNTFVFAQQKNIFIIQGRVLDSANKQPLIGATITLLKKEDSTTAAFGISDKLGGFQLKNIIQSNYILIASYTSYQDFYKEIDSMKALPTLDFGDIHLALTNDNLGNVIVKSPPISIKKDTIEFKASSFKTPPNANVEDLLKKLPGMEVDKDGNIIAQGESINKIYVDGKEFFSNDPKLAAQNITSEMVESIQVFDDMSDQAKFTKMDDGSRTRTINIKLKKDRNKGIFGKTTLGIGTNNRYTASTAINHFNAKTQISFLGSANNINRLGFNYNDLISSIGGSSGVGKTNRTVSGDGNGTSGNGNTKSWGGGINIRQQFGTKLQLSGNYFISNVGNQYHSFRNTQNFFSNDSTSVSTAESFSQSNSLGHNATLRLQYDIDSMNSILILPNFGIQHSNSNSYDSVTTKAFGKLTPGYTAIAGNTQQNNQRDGWGASNNFLFKHRFKKLGRTISLGWAIGSNRSTSNGFNTSPYNFFKSDGSNYNSRNLRLMNNQNTHSFNNSINTSFTESLGKNSMVELNYTYTNNHNVSDRSSYNFNPITNNYDSVNKAQTNYFATDYIANKLGTNYRYKKEKFDFQLGGSVQFATIKNFSHRAITAKDSITNQHFINFFPRANFNYNIGLRKSMRFSYNGSTKAPTIGQLQDIVDSSNVLNIRTGNPNLKQEFNNGINFSYNNFNVSNFMFFNLNISASFTNNKIVNGIDTASKFVLFTKPDNLNGAFSTSFSSTLGIPLKKVATGKRSPLNLNLSTSFHFTRDVSLLYKQINYSNSSSFGERVHITYSIDNKLDLGVNARLGFNDVKYTITQANNHHYFTQNYSMDITYTAYTRLNIGSEFNYIKNSGQSAGYNQALPLWNANISYLIFEKRNAEIKLTCNDILKQNNSIGRSIGDNYIQDSKTDVLQRFFVLSFMYNLNQFGGRKIKGGKTSNNKTKNPMSSVE